MDVGSSGLASQEWIRGEGSYPRITLTEGNTGTGRKILSLALMQLEAAKQLLSHTVLYKLLQADDTHTIDEYIICLLLFCDKNETKLSTMLLLFASILPHSCSFSNG